jgi:hypothetical protein
MLDALAVIAFAVCLQAVVLSVIGGILVARR